MSAALTVVTPCVNYLLIYVARMGIDGAALANNVEAALYCAMLLTYFIVKERGLIKSGRHTWHGWCAAPPEQRLGLVRTHQRLFRALRFLVVRLPLHVSHTPSAPALPELFSEGMHYIACSYTAAYIYPRERQLIPRAAWTACKLMLPSLHLSSWHSVRSALRHRSWGAFKGWGQYLAIALPALSMKCTGAPGPSALPHKGFGV